MGNCQKGPCCFCGHQERPNNKNISQNISTNETSSRNTITPTQLKMESQCYELEKKMKEYDDEEKKLEHEEKVCKEKIKEAMNKKNKKDEKKWANQAAHIRKKMQYVIGRRKILSKKKNSLETAKQDFINIELSKWDEKMNKYMQEYNQKLAENIEASNEAKINQKTRRDQMRELEGSDSCSEEREDIMKEIENEVKQEQLKKIAKVKNIGKGTAGVGTEKENHDQIARALTEFR